jgi:hypothetical protein
LLTVADAGRWLADRGVTQVGDGEWSDSAIPGRRLSANEIAHSWVGQVFSDEDLNPSGQLRLAFGLLDLLDDYWVTCEIRFVDRGPDGPLPAELLWNGYRQRLEAVREAEAVTYSLWADWFEDRDTAEAAFAEVLGHDAGQLLPGASAALLRRARRVMECSGPVPWSAKQATYGRAAQVPALHLALFRGLLASYHDFYGDLEPAPALALLAKLDLPADTAHLAELRSALATGHENHYRNPTHRTMPAGTTPKQRPIA